MQLKRASDFSLADLVTYWNQGYTGYFVPINFSESAMANHIRCGDLDLNRSVVLMDGDDCVGFSYVGVRGERGWIGGFGVTPAYRGKGLSYSLFADHVALCRETGLTHLLLDVFVENWARKTYERAGLQVTRRFGIHQGKLAAVAPLSVDAGPIGEAGLDALLPHSDRLHAAHPAAWQREPGWITKADTQGAMGLHTGDLSAPTGFVLYRTVGERVQLFDAVATGLAQAYALIGELARRYPGYAMGVINEPDDSPIYRALISAGLPEVKAQYEMHWRA